MLAKKVQSTGGLALKKRDKVKEALAKYQVEKEADVEAFKSILKMLKDSKDGREVVIPKDDAKEPSAAAEAKEDGAEKAAADAADEGTDGKEKDAEADADEEPLRKRREGSLHLKLFMHVAKLSLCSQEREGKDNAHCVNLLMVDREVHEDLDAKQ